MKKAVLFDFTVDKDKQQIHVTRAFNGELALVWRAWTEPELLDQWWAPRPYTNHTKQLDLIPGGLWHYYMKSPAGEVHWCLFAYEAIHAQQQYSGRDSFCDEQAQPSNALPGTHWTNTFIDNQDGTTTVKVVLQYDSIEALETIVSMGFKEGFTMGLNQLDELLVTLK